MWRYCSLALSYQCDIGWRYIESFVCPHWKLSASLQERVERWVIPPIVSYQHDMTLQIFVNIGSGNGLSPLHWLAITWTNVGILSIGPSGTYFSEILIQTQQFFFKKVHLKMAAILCWLQCVNPSSPQQWLISPLYYLVLMDSYHARLPTCLPRVLGKLCGINSLVPERRGH